MKSDSLVIIPTYNEAHNISRLIDEVMNLEEKIDMLIVDDGSPDGTIDKVNKKKAQYPDRIFTIEREGKQGLGTAYVAGFIYALDNGYVYICEMDADFSHNPVDLPKLVNTIKSGEADVAVGSRYSKEIGRAHV